MRPSRRRRPATLPCRSPSCASCSGRLFALVLAIVFRAGWPSAEIDPGQCVARRARLDDGGAVFLRALRVAAGGCHRRLVCLTVLRRPLRGDDPRRKTRPADLVGARPRISRHVGHARRSVRAQQLFGRGLVRGDGGRRLGAHLCPGHGAAESPGEQGFHPCRRIPAQPGARVRLEPAGLPGLADAGRPTTFFSSRPWVRSAARATLD